jgi:carbonic anhydrase
MNFCTAINCIDGRVQLPVIKYLQKRFGVEFVDSITVAAPSLILADDPSSPSKTSLLDNLKISIERHHSVGIAVVSHHNCAGNPTSKEKQTEQTQAAVQFLKTQYERVEVIGLWIDENWNVVNI